jgi:hypothetical protein
MPDDLDGIRRILRRATPELLARVNVVATGVGYKVSAGVRTSDLCIVCSVTRKVPLEQLPVEHVVPPRIDGIPSDVIQTGPLRALQFRAGRYQPAPGAVVQSRTGRYRPAPGGVSIGHRDITAGTLGCLVKRDGGTETLILSNNHVLADSNNARIGDPILQPGPIDGGNLPEAHLANLLDFVPIRFSDPEPPSDCQFAQGVIALLNAGCRIISSRTRYRIVRIQAQENLVDAAIARPLNREDVRGDVLEIGTIRGVVEAQLGTAVRKSGRTTGVTTGEILQVDVTADVQYGQGRAARFTDQLLAGPMSQGGDSGSAVLDTDNRLVGLLFAGSENTTVINRMRHVFSALRVGL